MEGSDGQNHDLMGHYKLTHLQNSYEDPSGLHTTLRMF